MTDLYETLGVSKSADADEIKRAYRQKAKETHPDVTDGDQAAFQSVALAHRILSDAERRAKYDATGDTSDEPNTKQSSAMQMVAQVINGLLERPDAIHYDLVNEAKKTLRQANADHSMMVKKAQAEIGKLIKVRARFKAKKGPDRIGIMLDQQIAQRTQALVPMTAHTEIIALAMALVEDAVFEPDARPQRPMTAYGLGGATTFFSQTGPTPR